MENQEFKIGDLVQLRGSMSPSCVGFITAVNWAAEPGTFAASHEQVKVMWTDGKHYWSDAWYVERKQVK